MRNQLLLSVLALGVAFSIPATASESLNVIKTINIKAPATEVWQKVSQFGDLGAWHPAVAKTQITLGQEGMAGADRVLTLQDGGKINETLTAYNPEARSMSYVITGGVLPVKAYASTLRVLPNGDNNAVVVWEGAFQSAEGASDQAAVETIAGVYDAGLANLKKIAE